MKLHQLWTWVSFSDFCRAGFHHCSQVICKNKWQREEEADCVACVCTQQPYSLCPSGPKVMRCRCPTGAAGSQPRPQTPAGMLTQSLQLLSNPSLSPLILLDRVSAEHLNNTPIQRQPGQRPNCRGQLLPVSISAVSLLSWADPTVRIVQLL